MHACRAGRPAERPTDTRADPAYWRGHTRQQSGGCPIRPGFTRSRTVPSGLESGSPWTGSRESLTYAAARTPRGSERCGPEHRCSGHVETSPSRDTCNIRCVSLLTLRVRGVLGASRRVLPDARWSLPDGHALPSASAPARTRALPRVYACLHAISGAHGRAAGARPGPNVVGGPARRCAFRLCAEPTVWGPEISLSFIPAAQRVPATTPIGPHRVCNRCKSMTDNNHGH